jgi:lysyl-tRNA synthetase class 1
VDKITAILKRHNLPIPGREVLQSRIAYARYWVDNFAPPEVRLQLQETLPDAVESLTSEQREALNTLADRLQPDMNGDDIHALVYSLTQDGDIEPQALFQAIYTAFLGQPRGPRVGWFLGSLEFDFVHTRLQEAAGAGV